MNVTRKSQVKVMGRWVAVPNWMIRETPKWSAEKIARVEANAARLGAVQTAVTGHWTYPVALVLGFFGGIAVAQWAVNAAVDLLVKP